MNYLAHIYLSGNNREHAIGNFIADSVKGAQWKNYPLPFQRGILLHRAIDLFTDSHAIFRKHTHLLFPKYRHYSRVIVDMYYDHFLAHHWSIFHPLPLHDFTNRFYNSLELHCEQLPEVIVKRLPYLIRDNWLMQYDTLPKLRGILTKMEKRTQFPSYLSESVVELKQNYAVLEADFHIFFRDLACFCTSHLDAGEYSKIPYFDSLKNPSK